MKGKILFLISLLVLAIFIAGCKEQAGEAGKFVSPVEVNAVKVDQDSLRTQVDTLTNTVITLNAKYDSLKTEYENSKVKYDQLKIDYDKTKADLAKFTQATNGKLELLKVKAGITGADSTKWESFPILTGYSWNNANVAGMTK